MLREHEPVIPTEHDPNSGHFGGEQPGSSDLLVTAPHSNPYRPTMDPGELRRATMIEPKAVSSHPPDIAKVLEPFANSIGTANAKLIGLPAVYSRTTNKASAEAEYRGLKAQAESFSGAIDDYVTDMADSARNHIALELGDGRAEPANRAAALDKLEARLAPINGLVDGLRAWKRATERSSLDWAELTTMHDRLQADIENFQKQCIAALPTQSLNNDALSAATIGVAKRLAGLGAEIARQGADVLKYEAVTRVWASEAVAQRLLTTTAQDRLARTLATNSSLDQAWAGSAAARVTDRMFPSGASAKPWSDARDAATRHIMDAVAQIDGYRKAPTSERDSRITDMIITVTGLKTKLEEAAVALDGAANVPDPIKADLKDVSALLTDELRGRLSGLNAMMDARQGARMRELIKVLATYRTNTRTTYEREVADLKPMKLGGLWSDAKDALIKEIRRSDPENPKVAAASAEKLEAAFDQNLRGALTKYANEMAKGPKYAQRDLHDAVWDLRRKLERYRAGINAFFNTSSGSVNPIEQKFYRTLDLIQIAMSNQLREAAENRKGSLF